MRIAEVSKTYDISPDTLRYYERIGLLNRIPRTASGVREYGEQDCARIQFVKCMRSAGVSIEALTEYMRLLDEGDSTIRARIELLEHQRDLVQARVDEMQAGLDRLNSKITNYEKGLRQAERKLQS